MGVNFDQHNILDLLKPNVSTQVSNKEATRKSYISWQKVLEMTIDVGQFVMEHDYHENT